MGERTTMHRGDGPRGEAADVDVDEDCRSSDTTRSYSRALARIRRPPSRTIAPHHVPFLPRHFLPTLPQRLFVGRSIEHQYLKGNSRRPIANTAQITFFRRLSTACESHYIIINSVLIAYS